MEVKSLTTSTIREETHPIIRNVRKRRARKIFVACHKCARMCCNKNPCSLGMMSDNREDKIQFITDGLNKESLDDIILSLEAHPSGYV